MSTSEISPGGQSKRTRLPHWMTPIFLTALFLLVHVVLPWGLSLLSTRYGWVDGRPGPWNLLALILVVAGIACTIWLIVQHFRASPGSFLELKPGQKLLTPGPYAFSRNPMYLSELAFWFGWALFYGSITVFIGFLLWFVMFNFVIVPYEERDLEARFGETYRQYKKMVPRWLGKTRPGKGD
ncbi:MAG: isoprenylcysteine carboxylmethyltransferase family protein [Chloroflexi bacterium]|nr:isoprenylcysteine carboxylmethyltransferase family protein [Chloroflexota bacterium]MCI0575092.1 isoprenylcysteine carboxylmethyltransferase family protein [Chloroflexota bacterium]MCI0648206.1 isoprenylcysteine carboxylmethyltransferase family protein [Chloroflexota bacterium]MCI0730145.1 isoprenylcysteine carboxylmethyltransferase family protein [Chloroflexota bacterium]